MRIELTQDWPFEEVAKYGADITAAMNKLVARFPNDLSVEGLARDVFSGRNQLWLILDDDGTFKAFVLSEIKVNDDTGHKSVILTELAGEGGIDIVPLIKPIEAWAKSIGAQELRPMGRLGWRKALQKQGYEATVCLYSKDLTHG